MESFTLAQFVSLRSAVERLGGGGVQSLTAGAGIDISGSSGFLTITNTNPTPSQPPQLIGAISQYIYPQINNIPDSQVFIIPGFSITFTPTVNGYVDCNGAFTVNQDINTNGNTVYWQITATIYDNGVAVATNRFGSLDTTSPAFFYASLPYTLVAPVVAGHTYIIRPEMYNKNVGSLDAIFSGKVSVVFYPNATPLTPS